MCYMRFFVNLDVSGTVGPVKKGYIKGEQTLHGSYSPVHVNMVS